MQYDKDYYQDGLATGKSAYFEYRWLPDLTIPMAMSIIDYLGIKRNQTVLDYGCAKGYLVRALRLLKRKAYGRDISPYAISQVDKEVKNYCFLVNSLEEMNAYSLGCLPTTYDFCIAKDVFEHIPEIQLVNILHTLNAKNLFVVVPLGQDGKYFAPANNLDPSHILCEDEDWWSKLFIKCGYKINKFSYKMENMKEAYYSKTPNAHGFWELTNGK